MELLPELRGRYEGRRGMTELRRLEILGVYELFDTEDVSNERLLQMVADTCECEIDEVLEALKEDGT